MSRKMLKDQVIPKPGHLPPGGGVRWGGALSGARMSLSLTRCRCHKDVRVRAAHDFLWISVVALHLPASGVGMRNPLLASCRLEVGSLLICTAQGPSLLFWF